MKFLAHCLLVASAFCAGDLYLTDGSATEPVVREFRMAMHDLRTAVNFQLPR